MWMNGIENSPNNRGFTNVSPGKVHSIIVMYLLSNMLMYTDDIIHTSTCRQ